MTPALQRHDELGAELDALRNLEQAVRACGLPSIMVSGQRQLDSLAAALKQVVDARNMQSSASAAVEHG
ncbi:MAG TPA: hypothetical protein VGU61_09845 [Noviherbaspirillum sp.]|jgi:hypothetical protein|uniref:hypothetical protein n=1 Tax=Noviherbaspirillum sp. TaxID=1926288 RepID=UPI002DDD71C9|nr:hypothetical protein [Noviherbaspirillum sp.]HEV2610556.1 hypothetical protein [Noviherbaspirillum sp.]